MYYFTSSFSLLKMIVHSENVSGCIGNSHYCYVSGCMEKDIFILKLYN